jgi:pimeloyl-ACP methyl ester carboxylesterase
VPAGVERRVLATGRGPFAALVAGPEQSAHPVALLLPGWTGSKEDFLTLLPELARQGRRVVAVDQRGQFETTGFDRVEDYSLESFAADAAAVAQAVSDRPVDLVGHSFGGLVAARCAIDVPESCASVTLLCSGPAALPADRHDDLRALDFSLASDAPAVTWAAMRERDRADGLAMPPPQVETWLERRFTATSPASLRAMSRMLVETPDQRTALAARPVPVLVLTTEHDDGWPVGEQLGMADDVGAEAVVLSGLGHSPAVDDPAATAHALLGFWTRWEPRPPLVDTVLASGTDDVPRSRHDLRAALAGLDRGDDDWRFTAELLTSELVTNAVVHGSPPVRLVASVRGGHLVVSVHDSGAATDAGPRPDHGRGLHVVGALAHRCGGWSDQGGTTAWFWLPLAQPPSPRSGTPTVLGSNASQGAAAAETSLPSAHESR